MNKADQLSALISGLKAGDPVAAQQLYERFHPFIRAAVRRQLHPRLRSRFDSLDFVQDVWVSLLSCELGQYDFATPGALIQFLKRVAQNKVIEAVRHRFKTQKDDVRREVSIDPLEASTEKQVAAPTATPSQWVIADEEFEKLLLQFPEGYRAVVKRLRDGYSIDDIVRLTGISRSTVDRVIRRLKDLTGV